jgi:hypothetical protein
MPDPSQSLPAPSLPRGGAGTRLVRSHPMGARTIMVPSQSPWALGKLPILGVPHPFDPVLVLFAPLSWLLLSHIGISAHVSTMGSGHCSWPCSPQAQLCMFECCCAISFMLPIQVGRSGTAVCGMMPAALQPRHCCTRATPLCPQLTRVLFHCTVVACYWHKP